MTTIDDEEFSELDEDTDPPDWTGGVIEPDSKYDGYWEE